MTQEIKLIENLNDVHLQLNYSNKNLLKNYFNITAGKFLNFRAYFDSYNFEYIIPFEGERLTIPLNLKRKENIKQLFKFLYEDKKEYLISYINVLIEINNKIIREKIEEEEEEIKLGCYNLNLSKEIIIKNYGEYFEIEEKPNNNGFYYEFTPIKNNLIKFLGGSLPLPNRINGFRLIVRYEYINVDNGFKSIPLSNGEDWEEDIEKIADTPLGKFSEVIERIEYTRKSPDEYLIGKCTLTFFKNFIVSSYRVEDYEGDISYEIYNRDVFENWEKQNINKQIK